MGVTPVKAVPGALVDFFSDGRVVAGVVLSEDKGRLRVATEAGREERIVPARVLAAYQGNPKLAVPSGKAEAAKIEMARKLAASHAQTAQDLRSRLDLALTWEIVVDDGGERTLEDLAELAMGDRGAGPTAALLRELVEEKIHFTRRADLWEARSRDVVEEILRQRDRERLKEEQRTRFLSSVRDALTSTKPFQRSNGEEEARLLAGLEELAVEGAALGPASRDAETFLGHLTIPGENAPERAFRALVALGVFTESENLFIRKYGLSPDFPPGSDEMARAAVDGSAERLERERSSGSRRDLTSHDAFSVDDPLTSEIDDALSVEPLPGHRWRVGIHIADPGFLIPAGSHLDKLAESRAATFYLPERRVLMLPRAVSQEAGSLLAEVDRPALTFLVTLSESGSILGWEIVPSVIRSRARVSYEEASEAVTSGKTTTAADTGALPERVRSQILTLHGLAVGLEAARIQTGAHVIRAPEVDLRVDSDGTITLKRMEGDDPARLVVSEMMILASRVAAMFCLENSIPCIYRRQPPTEESAPAVLVGTPYDPVAVRNARRGLRRGESGLTPGRHYALGLDAYAQATSPIRRYQDLVIHRQIKSVLAGGPPCYDAESLQRITALTDEAERVARLAERGSDEYWTLKYLERQKGSEIEGVVVYKERRRVEVELSETLYSVGIAPRPDHELGQRLRFIVEEVHPRAPSLRLRQVD